jgi:hypothetical protein
MGISGAGITAALEAYRPVFMTVTFAFLAMAFYFTYRPRHGAATGQPDCCATQTPSADPSAPETPGGRRRFTMMAMNKAMLWLVTALAVAFLFFPQFFTRLLAPDDKQITPDMTRTLLKVEGMTCEG